MPSDNTTLALMFHQEHSFYRYPPAVHSKQNKADHHTSLLTSLFLFKLTKTEELASLAVKLCLFDFHTLQFPFSLATFIHNEVDSQPNTLNLAK